MRKMTVWKMMNKKLVYVAPDHNIIKALLGMLPRLPWGRSDVLGLMNGKYEGVYVKYASLIVSCHWIKVFITA